MTGTDLDAGPGAGADGDPRPDGRRAGELTPRELGRWAWRQLTSMRTALILLLLLALAAVPGSVVPQQGVDALAASRWRDDHPRLTPVYEWLDLFDVYGSVWFAAIYVLLMISLVGCIIPRTLVYARNIRAVPPAAPRNLGRLPDHASYESEEGVEEVLEQARAELRRRRYRLRPTEADGPGAAAVSGERGYLREVGNLVFHLSIIVVLVGFAMGSLFGYKGGVIVLVGNGFSNNLTQYDDFVPGSAFSADEMEPFSFKVEDFEVEWLTEGRARGQARNFVAQLRYREEPGAPEQDYDLRVNHPLQIGDSEVFLVGHGYAPVITVRDERGEVVASGPRVFLPQDQSFLSFGVIKAPAAEPDGLGLEGLFYPTFVNIGGDPVSVMGDTLNPAISMLVYRGDLGLDSGRSQSVYILEKDAAEQVTQPDGSPLRVDLQPGATQELPDGLGSITFEGVQPWVRVQVSQSPGKVVALVGVVAALVGLLGSLFIRPRRVWVRARREDGRTVVELAALDRSGGGDVALVLADIVEALRPAAQKEQS